MTLGAGDDFAGYTVIRTIGSGGMGEVYLVQHPRLPRYEALKILRPGISADDNFRARFIREADSVAALDHPHIVTVYDRGESDGQLWIATQYIDGTDAAQLLRDRYPAGMPVDEAVAIVTAIADALDYAHDRGLLHRDVKPANILLTQPDTNGVWRTYLADFGIVRPLDDPSGLTATNFTLGTVGYSAPEQLMGGTIDGRADQYALAATAYHLLTGVQPYTDSNPVAVIGHHLNAAVPKLSDRCPDLAALNHALSTAMAKNPDERFNRCRDFATALRSQVDVGPSSGDATQVGPTVAAPITSSTAFGADHAARRSPSVHRRGLSLAVVAVAVVAAVIALAALLTDRRGSDNRSGTALTAAPSTSSPGRAITFETMRDFVTRYYSQLPIHTEDAWAELGTRYQEKTGFQPYLNFWSTVESVSVIAVTPRGSNSVIARLTYAWKDGHSTTEDRWLSIAMVSGNIVIDDSELIFPPSTVTATDTPVSPQPSAPGMSAYDKEFLSLMAQEGWGCTDNSDPEQCQKQMVRFAHQVCSYSGLPIELVYQNFPVPPYFGPREERRAIMNAQQAYPNCTFTGS